jgi:hypothetical protein
MDATSVVTNRNTNCVLMRASSVSATSWYANTPYVRLLASRACLPPRYWVVRSLGASAGNSTQAAIAV